MANKRSIIVRGCPTVNEVGAASEAITPGYLVKGITTIAKQTGTGQVPVAIALERDELGAGIDDTYRDYAPAAAYASGDTVKVGVFKPGEQAVVYLASGQTIAVDATVVSAGNGLVTPGSTAGTVVGRAIDAVSVGVAAVTAIRIEVM